MEVMSRQSVRWLILLRGVLAPWVFLGVAFFALLYAASFMVDTPDATVLRKVAYVSLISGIAIGLLLSVIFLLRTRE